VSSSEKDIDRRTAPSSDAFRSIVMTGLNTSLERDAFLSRSFCIERLAEPKPEKGLLEVFGEETAMGVAFLLGPNGKRERRLRKDGIPELAGGVSDGPGEWPMPCMLVALSDGLREELEVEKIPPFFEWIGMLEAGVG
jgi:hypothetical protein